MAITAQPEQNIFHTFANIKQMFIEDLRCILMFANVSEQLTNIWKTFGSGWDEI